MKLFADTNWVIAAYFQQIDSKRSGVVTRFSEKNDSPWSISRPVLVECKNVFRSLGRDENAHEWSAFEADLGKQILISTETWEEIEARADDLFRRFSFRAALGTMDLMILASALKAEATHFLSFDTNSNLRAIAAVLKFKVFPELTTNDKRRMAALR